MAKNRLTEERKTPSLILEKPNYGYALEVEPKLRACKKFTLDDREDRTPILFDREFMSRVNVIVNPDRKYVVTTKYSLD